MNNITCCINFQFEIYYTYNTYNTTPINFKDEILKNDIFKDEYIISKGFTCDCSKYCLSVYIFNDKSYEFIQTLMSYNNIIVIKDKSYKFSYEIDYKPMYEHEL